MTDSGVFISRRSGIAHRQLMVVSSAVRSTHSTNAAATLRFTPLSSFPPKYWLVIIAKPAVSPCAKPKIRNVSGPVTPTPPSANSPSVLPTITASTML